VEVTQIERGLWRWTARHPGWTPADGGPDGWESTVGCLYWEAEDAVVLIDPLVPQDAGDRDRFLGALDSDVERLALPVEIMLTCAWHSRSADELAERYRATVRVPDFAAPRVARAVAFRPDEPLPGRVVAVTALPASEEVVYWLPAPRAVVPGDTVLGAEGGGVRLCPASWLSESMTRADLAAALRPLLDLPVERILVSHGTPILAGGGAALARAFAEATVA